MRARPVLLGLLVLATSITPIAARADDSTLLLVLSVVRDGAETPALLAATVNVDRALLRCRPHVEHADAAAYLARFHVDARGASTNVVTADASSDSLLGCMKNVLEHARFRGVPEGDYAARIVPGSTNDTPSNTSADPFLPRVTIAEVRAQRGLVASIATRVVRREASAFVQCYQLNVPDPLHGFSGDVRIDLLVSPDGSAQMRAVLADEDAPPALTQCIGSRARTLRFEGRPPRTPSLVTIKVSFTPPRRERPETPTTSRHGY